MTKRPALKSTSRWDATLDRSVCDRYNNCDLTLIMRLCLRKVDPPAGATSDTYPDANGQRKTIVPWSAEWDTWTSAFKGAVEQYLDKKYWLKCADGFGKWDFVDKGVTYRPNIWCRLNLKLENSPSKAHHTIDVVRLDSSEKKFRSKSKLYDNLDTVPVMQPHGVEKITHVHEIAHLLGLGHVGQSGPKGLGWFACKINVAFGGTTNDKVCYGVTLSEKQELMGSGNQIHDWHAAPWQEAAFLHSGIAQGQWVPTMRRFYPRSPEDIKLNRWPELKPKRN